jgi:hypothetical protein
MASGSASMGGSTGALIGIIIGIFIPATDTAGNSFSLLSRLTATGGAVMDTPAIVMSALYIGIAMLVCGALGAIIGSLAE